MEVIEDLNRHIQRHGYLCLDGGLATALESKGHVLDDNLWSARILRDAPGEILAVHREFLEAGARCISSASYQAHERGFVQAGISAQEGCRLIDVSIELAIQAREGFLRDSGCRDSVFVAASLGPYGAFLADGSEYQGDYDLDATGLSEFHGPRFAQLASSAADWLACETIPSMLEVEVLRDLFLSSPQTSGWVSFSCRNDSQLSDGTPIESAVEMLVDASNVFAVGVNCVDPGTTTALLRRMSAVAGDKLLLAYPNSGGRYNAESNTWSEAPDACSWESDPQQWFSAGARLIGGCCRVEPEQILTMRNALRPAVL